MCSLRPRTGRRAESGSLHQSSPVADRSRGPTSGPRRPALAELLGSGKVIVHTWEQWRTCSRLGDMSGPGVGQPSTHGAAPNQRSWDLILGDPSAAEGPSIASTSKRPHAV